MLLRVHKWLRVPLISNLYRQTMDVPILHEDAQLLVVCKPGGMLSQADETGDQDLVAWAKAYLRGMARPDPYVGLVHRLDRPASGVMVLAKTPAAARELSRQFRERLPTKRYAALVDGKPPLIATCEDYIAKVDRKVRIVAPSDPQGKRAALRYQRLATQGNRSLLDVTLLTGRPHQVRIQLATRGHPLLGDVRYGGSDAFDRRTIALHCYALEVEHPEAQRPVRNQAPLPDTWPAFAHDALAPRLALHS